MTVRRRKLLPGFWLFQDTCNVYVAQRGERAIAIEYGSGEWRASLAALGIRRLDHVFLTHHHADLCWGLQGNRPADCTIHAPQGEQAFLDPAKVRKPGAFQPGCRGCPTSYAVLRGGVPDVDYDTVGFGDMYWQGCRIRFLHTPGHGPYACTVVLDHAGRQVVCCGDAAHAGATLWQPYHLEWDHWTGAGALAAWEGVVRLAGICVDLLCPAHGPVVTRQPRAVLQRLAARLLEFYRVKGQISAGEPDRYVEPELTASGARRWLPALYQYGNGCVLASRTGEALVVDPYEPEMPQLEELLVELGGLRPTVAVVTHYHVDHCDGIPYLRRRYGTRAVLHPRVAEALQDVTSELKPWVPAAPIEADELWPVRGTWRWNEYIFRVAPWPGQTWWHCAFMTTVAGRKVLFGGDSFQPASRWNGTGGFCAFNRSRFSRGYIPSARLALRWRPDVLVNGHDTCFRFSAAKFHKIIRWARRAERAVRGLCPRGDLEREYYAIPNLEGGYDPVKGALFWL